MRYLYLKNAASSYASSRNHFIFFKFEDFMRRYLHLFFITFVLFSLIITSLFPPQTVAASPLQVPTITFTMTDTLIDDGAGLISPDEDGDGKADPGETLEYTVVIANGGADPATEVTFNDILDLNTTLVGGSLNISPLALDDSYTTIGNTLLDVGISTPDPAVHVTNTTIDSLFDNDTEFLGDSFTLKSVESDITAPFITTSEQGGTVTVESDGNFSYLPAAGFSGTDHFDYVITDYGPDNVLGNTDDLTGAGRVTITVTPEKVWYVKNDAASGGLGRSTDPFDTLLGAEAASSANDTIYVFQGNGTTTGQNAGITLKEGQHLIGEGVALTVPVAVNGGPNPTILRTVGSQPLIDNTGGFGISVPDSTHVQIFGLNVAGSTNAVDVTTTAAHSGGFELANNTIRSAGGNGIDVNAGGSGTLTVSLHDNTVTSTGNGIDIQRTAGSVNIIAFDDNVVHGNTAGTGINIVGTGATILFDANPITPAFDTVSGGTTSIGQLGNGVGQSGFVLNNIRGDLSFTDLDVYADNGTALLVNGTSPNYTGTSGTRVVVNPNISVLSAVGGPAVNLTDVSVNLMLNSLFSINSTTTGVSLFRVAGTFSAPSGSSITNATGVDFSINGNSNANANVSVSYAGTITDTSGMLVQMQNVTATSTHTFSGAITDSGGTSTGISLTGNTGAMVTFSGGLSLSSGASPAFTATGGGTVNVCDENPCNAASTGSMVNTLTTTTGTALHVANTNIGSNDLEFRSISANGATNGIILNSTGSSGNLVIKGNGGSCTSAVTCTGGAIRNTTGDGISLTSTNGVSLTRLFVGTTGGHGINTSGVNGLTLTSSYMTNAGNGDNEHGLNLVNVQGTVTLDGTTIDGAAEDLVHLQNNNVNATLTVTNNSQFSYPASVGPFANSAFLILPSGTSAITANIQNSTFTNIKNLSVQIGAEAAGSNGTQSFTFSNNTVNIALAGRAGGVFVSGQESTTTNIAISNNNFNGAGGNGVVSLDTNDTAVIRGQVSGNGIINPPGIGIFVAVDEGGRSDVTVDSNTITNSGGDGIQTVNFGGNGVSTMDMTITNNMVNGHSLNTAVNFVGGIAAFALSAPPEAGDSSCVVVRGNTVTATPASPTQCGGAPCVDYYIEETAGVMTFEEVPNTASTTLNAAYVNSINDAGTVSVFGTIDLTNGLTCNVTGLGMTPQSNYVFAQALPETNADIRAQAADSPSEFENTVTVASTTVQQSDTVFAVTTSPNLGGGKPLFSLAPVPAQSGETVDPITIGTLPVGKGVTIKFRVTVNDPVSTSRILNQGNVTYTGGPGGGVNTTDPSPNADSACSGTGTQTCTPTDRPDTTVVSINRNAPLLSPLNDHTNAMSVTWRVTFGTAISSLGTGNFTLLSGGTLTGASVTSVTAVGGTPATEWDVLVNTGSGDGLLELNMTSDAELSHDISNLSFTTGEDYTIDKTAPTTTSFTRQDPSASPTRADALVFRVTFSEAIDGTIGAEDFTVSGTTATVTSVAFVSASVYDVQVSGGDLTSFNGVVGLNFSSGMDIRDLAGNDVASTGPTTDDTYTVDNAAPDVTLSSASSDPTNASPIPVTVQFSENVSGFSVTVLVAGNATVGNFNVVDGDTYTFDLTPSGQGSVTVDIAAGVAIDAVGNGNTVAAQFSRAFDSDAPTAVMTSAASDPTNTSPITVTVQFSENVTGFTAGDITTSNGTLGNFNAADGDTYTFDLTASSQGQVKADIAAGAAEDSSGNGNLTAMQFSRTFDSVGPTVTMTSAASNPANASPISVTAQFSENVTGFNIDDIAAGNATVGNFNAVDGATYTFELTPSSQGLVTAEIAAEIATDEAGNSNEAASQFSRIFDGDVPKVTMSSAASNPTNTSTIPVTVQFSENVTGFDAGDITTSNATVDSFGVMDGDTYTFDLIPTGEGLVTADIAANTAQDGSGNLNSAASQFSRTFDTLAPTVTINQAATQIDPTSATPINFTVTFSEPVTGFSASDVTLSGTAGATTAAVTGGPTIYNVAVSGMTRDGMVIADIAVGIATDGINLNAASTSTDNSVLYVANPTEHIISGNVGVGNVTLSYMDGTAKTAISQPDGSYSFQVSFNWTGTVTATHACYNFNPVSLSYSNVVLDQTSQDYAPTLDTSSSCADVTVSIAGADQNQFVLPPHEKAETSITGVNNGLVKIESTNALPILGMEQVIYKVKGTNVSFSEMMGLPDSELDSTYWLPWYNNIGLDTQLRFGNASSSTATVHVTIGNVEMQDSPYTLLPNQSIRVSFPGVNNGPVKLESDQKIVAAERVIYKVSGTQTSFSEMMALPNSRLDTLYWLPWYNNFGLDSQLRVANVTDQPASVHVFIGGQEMEGSPFNLAPGGSTRVSFPGVNAGPVKIESDQKIVAAERVIYKVSSIQTSFSEMMALPNSQLNTTYWLPWYNNVDLDTQLRLANTSPSTATVHVYVGGVEMADSPFTLLANQGIRVSFPETNAGPVKIVSNQNIVVAERVIYKDNGIYTSYSEIMGLPESLLNAIYWFPWYNNIGLETRVRFVVP
jgi:hypothetical protein